MSPSRIFILRPVATSLMMAGVVLVGFTAFRQLPVSALPQVDYPTMQIQTFYPGASPEVVTSSITAPLEKQFGQVPGLTQMTSISSFSSSLITLQFSLDLSIDIAEQEVQAAISAATSLLPSNLPVPPIYSKTNPADAPILTLAITSDTVPLPKVEELAETRIAQRISQLKGVGLVSLSGGQRPAVRVQANPTALASYGLSLESLRTALASANVNQAKGSFDGPDQAWTINDNDQLEAGAQYGPIILAYRNGAPIRISDVATIIDGAENTKLAAWVNADRALVVNIQRQPGTNIISVVDTVQALLPQIEASLPEGIHVQVISDRTTTIRASVKDVEFELMLTTALVVMVIFLFLRSASATIIPGIAVPLSLIGTFAVMYMLGYSLDNLSLMALTISTGFVVDDAIVMIENISRYMEMGETAMQAALKGSAEIGFTIVSLTVSLIAVLIPLLFMADIVGRLFREFAVTLAVTIIFSAFVSLTLTPMMAGRILKHHPESEQGRLYRWSEWCFVKTIEGYGAMVRVVLRHQPLTLLVAVGTLVLTVYLYDIVPKGFFPVQDTGAILGISQAPETVSFDSMSKLQQDLVKVIRQDPAVQNLTSFIGADGVNTTMNSGRIQITLKALEDRAGASAVDVIRRLSQKVQQVAGIELFMQPVQDLTVEDRISRTQYQYALDAPDKALLDLWIPKLMERLKKLPELRDVASDQQNNGLGVLVNIDRDTAGRLGITPQNVDDALYDSFGQRQVSTIYTQTNQFHVILEVAPKYQKDRAALGDMYVPIGSASANLASTIALAGTNSALTGAAALAPAPLRAFVTAAPVPSPITINHQSQFPVVTLSFNLAPGASLGAAVEHIKEATKALGMPASIEPSFQGTAKAFESSLANESILILAAIVTVYLVLGVLYESFIHPITILSTLPSAGVGAVLALIVFHKDLDVIALIGIILLIGIVKKNAIMMIDFALEAERKEGKSPEEAIYQACLLRFRPIMMTTMAALLGAVPLAFGSGVGSELRQPLGICIIGGLLVSQVLTLFTTPVIYLFFGRLSAWATRGSRKSEEPLSGARTDVSLAPMSISTPFIQRPVATTLLLVAVTMAGAISYTLLPVSALPEVDFPTIFVSASLPGASPDVMAASIATPLEKQFTRIAGVTEMTSRSSVGSVNVTLQFDLSRDINGAAREVQAAINSSAGNLPANLPSLPRYRKINPADQPILLMTLESDVVPRPQLYDIASSVFAQKLAQVNGVGQVSVGGSSLPAVRVEVNPQPLSRYNVGLDQIGTFLQNANANKPKGSFANATQEVPLYATDQLFLAKDYQDLVVVYRNGAPVRLSDLGRVIDGNEDVRNLGLVNGNPMVQIQISRQPNANIVDTVARIKALMPQFNAQLPPSVHFKIASDRTITTRDSLRDAQRNMIVSIVLVVLVVFVFLRSGWSTFIPSVSVPVSIVATFGAMYLIGYTLDNLSLMALTIATGFVVDDAIVVIENITRHLENGLKPMEAALKGAEEIGFTVLSMSISLIAVFIPILMMSGVVGRLFREFAVVLSVAIAISMVISVTVVPMLCAWLLKEHRSHGYIYNVSEDFYQWIISTYASALRVVLDHPGSILVTLAVTMGVNVYLYDKIPKGFFPQQDTGRLQGNVQGEQHISYAALVDKAKWFEEKVRVDPDVETVTMVAGSSGGGFGGANSAMINVQLKPVGVRKATSDQVIARLRRQTSGVPGATLFLQNSQDVRIGGRQSNAQYQYTLQGPTFDLLATWGPKVLEYLTANVPEIADLSSDQQNSGLSSNVIIDRDTASRLGLTAQAVDSALYDAFGQRQVSVMYKSINQYHVVLALQQQWWESPDFLRTIYVQTPKGTDVPLSTFTHFTQGLTPISLPHQGQFPATTISFNLAENVALSDAETAINRAVVEMGLPANITGKFAGTAQAYQEALKNQPILIGTALIAVYIVLGILYESLIHPLTIISTLPSAGVGALVAMVLFKSNLDLIGMIGIILLIGIVKKNAIMMIDFALAAERNEGMNSRDAIYQACLLRFRPIMMTTMCALLGGLPMALGWGAGAELRKPLGIAIVGGLVVSQMLTLFTTPVIYLYFDRLRNRFRWRKASYRNRPDFLIPGGLAESGD